MQLVQARVRNFRSLREVSIEFGPHTALIGGNGAGKSSLLKAIERFYSTSKTLDADDYFGRDQTQPVEIELTFGDLTEPERETFASRVRDDRLVVTRVFDSSGQSGRYHGLVLQNPDFTEVRAQATAQPKRDAYRALRETPAYADLPVAGSAAAVDDHLSAWEAVHPDQLVLQRDNGQFFGFQNAGRGELQRHTAFVFIPAVREASVDAADGKTSAIGRLLELIVRSAILDRIVVGEMRDGAAALETLKSWNTGHPGGLSTIHANSAEDVLRRIEDLMTEVVAQAPRRAIAQAVDRIVHIRRTPEGRRVEAVLAVDGLDGDDYRLTALA